MIGVGGGAREAMLFAAVAFLVGGIDDLTVDAIYIWRRLLRRAPWRRMPLADLPPVERPGRIAVFIAAWDEADVIGPTLNRALARFEHPDYRIYVGAYPNDPDTVEAIAAVAERDPRVRMVVGRVCGPTTKADNLNTVWRAMLRDEVADGACVKAVLLHDAEDLVDPHELRVIDALIEHHAAVQLPVEPVVVPGSTLISGHYCDEFALAHGLTLPVRQSVGAALPLAGTGCAISREMIGRIADDRGGVPFDGGSLTEDYELGLEIAARGGRGVLARIEAPDGRLVAVRACFPSTFRSAARQKARWMVGIALAGWDRTGWSAGGEWRDHWMRLRDRRGPFAMLAIAMAYLACALWAVSLAINATLDVPMESLSPEAKALALVNFVMLGWRTVVRAALTARIYGWRTAGLTFPRMVVGNIIALAAARRALVQYCRWLRGTAIAWDKTAHVVPVAGAWQ